MCWNVCHICMFLGAPHASNNLVTYLDFFNLLFLHFFSFVATAYAFLIPQSHGPRAPWEDWVRAWNPARSPLATWAASATRPLPNLNCNMHFYHDLRAQKAWAWHYYHVFSVLLHYVSCQYCFKHNETRLQISRSTCVHYEYFL